MRNKLALIIALSGFAAVTALGVGMAGADSAGELGSGNAVEAAPGITTEGTEVIPQCENGIDDDEDGLVDMEDPNCTEPGDPVEGPEPGEPEPAPAPSPSPTPAPTPGTPVEAAPETGPSRPSTGVQAGSSLNAAEAPEAAGAGQARTQAAVRVVPGSHYSTHESTLLSGTVVREFVGADGVIFGVAWQGPTQPDLSQFLGSSYAAYLDAARQQHVARSRHLSIDRPDLVIEHNGRMRAFAGHAYLPQRLPPGVSAAEIR